MLAAQRALVIGCLCLGLAGVMRGQQSEQARLPDAPTAVAAATAPPVPKKSVVFHKRIFWSLVGVDAASAVADTQTSWHNEQTYQNGYEQNSWLYGKRPSLARYYLTDAVIDGGVALVGYKLLNARRGALRATGWALLGAALAAHTEGWIYNVNQLSNAPPPARSYR